MGEEGVVGDVVPGCGWASEVGNGEVVAGGAEVAGEEGVGCGGGERALTGVGVELRGQSRRCVFLGKEAAVLEERREERGRLAAF